jgi:hypothetical protein
MRCTQIFVLRLLLDSDAPQALRGSITRVSDGDPHPFADTQQLLKLLGEMARLSPEQQPDEDSPRGTDGSR